MNDVVHDPGGIFITKLQIGEGPVRVAVKDLIDLAGTVTTAGCRSVERRAQVASDDAHCLCALRDAVTKCDVTIVGKTNLCELAFGADGLNSEYGSPDNPLDSDRIPGGSSSGSGVAVATGLADIALGTDTGGSIRIPAACCGIVGFKPTWGRVSNIGVWPLAPFLDTVGPMARDVSGVVAGMDLLEPGFAATIPSGRRLRIGRARPVTEDIHVDPAIDRAIDAALACLTETAGRDGGNVVEITLPLWRQAQHAGLVLLLGEAWRSDVHLLVDPDGVQQSTRSRLLLGAKIEDIHLRVARRMRPTIQSALDRIWEIVDVIALPTMPLVAPLRGSVELNPMTSLVRYANLAALPAIALPVPRSGEDQLGPDAHLPPSLQLIGAPGQDALVCAAALAIEAATANPTPARQALP